LLIASEFGNVASFEGLNIGDHEVSLLSKTLALLVTAVGVPVIFAAIIHERKTTAWG
jgi:hypothetical protein